MSTRKVGPMFQQRHYLDPDRRRKLAYFVATLGLLGASKRIGCSLLTIRELASGGGTTRVCHERVCKALDAAEVAA